MNTAIDTLSSPFFFDNEQMVPSKALQDHKDWDLVEHFEYQQAIRAAKKDKIY